MSQNFLSNQGYRWIKPLGEGAFGQVDLYEKNGHQYAIKTIDLKHQVDTSIAENKIRNQRNLKQGITDYQYLTDRKQIEDFFKQSIEKELFNAQKIKELGYRCGDYFNFILTYDLLESSDQKYYLVSEPMTSDLSKFLVNPKGCRQNDCPEAIVPGLAQNRDELIMAVVCQLLYAVYCLHQIGLVHGDLKPSNIFIDGQTGQIKIADFGGSGWMRSDFEKVNQRIDARTPIFSAPEVIQDPSLVTGKSDVWSLGVTILALIIKYPKVIYKYSLSDKPQAMIDEIIEQQVNMKDKAIEKWLKELLKNMLIKDPRTRQGLHQIVNETNRKCKVPVEKILSAKSKDEDDDYIILNLPKDIEQIIREFLILW